MRQVPVHKIRVVGRVHIHAAQHPVCVVQRDVERRTADQRRQPGHLLLPVFVEPLQQLGQRFFQKGVTHFQRMPLHIPLAPGLCQLHAELFQRLVPHLVRKVRRPHPLHAQRRLTPAFRGIALPILDPHADPGTSHIGQRFGTELQRHPRLHRQEVKPGRAHLHIRILAHLNTSFLTISPILQDNPLAIKQPL